jgi:hypothetical protein
MNTKEFPNQFTDDEGVEWTRNGQPFYSQSNEQRICEYIADDEKMMFTEEHQIWEMYPCNSMKSHSATRAASLLLCR